MKTLLAIYLGVSLLMPAQDNKPPVEGSGPKPEIKAPDFRAVAKADAMEYENFQLKIDLLTAQRDKLRMSLCEKYGLATTCVVGQKQDGQWVAVMPPPPIPALKPPTEGGSPGQTGPTGHNPDATSDQQKKK